MVNGQFLVAQEITVQMTADYSVTTLGAIPIGNLNNEVVDNENAYTGTATTNSFKVSADGTYQVLMNAQIETIGDTNPVIGVWDDTSGNWIARVNDQFVGTNAQQKLQTYTLITSVPMVASHTYSFRIAGSGNSSVVNPLTIKHLSSGGTGSGPVTFVSLKRLK